MISLLPLSYPLKRRKTSLREVATGVQGLRISSQLSALANEAPPEVEALSGLANAAAPLTSDGWALIPYGQHPNQRGLQPFGRAEAEQMVKYFKNGWNTIKRAFVGMPILRGHPDMAKTVKAELKKEKDPAKQASLQALINTITARYPDQTVYGTVADLEARDEGLALRIVLTEDGEALVNEQGLTHFSPHWLCKNGEPINGQPTKIPVYLVSLGLTNRPNIPGTSLVNEQAAALPGAEPSDLSTMNKAHLLALLAALGHPLANEATDEQINAALVAAAPTASALAARPETTALVNEQSRATQLAAELATAQTALANEQAAHAAATTARNEALVDAAILAGRVTSAQKPVWLGRLARDFATEVTALANEKAAVKTTATTATLGNRKAPNTARDQFTALVNERTAKGEAWDAAWMAVKATDAGKALYEQMNTPAA